MEVSSTSQTSARVVQSYPDVLTRWHAVLACTAALLVALCLYPQSRAWFGGHAGEVLQIVGGLFAVIVIYMASLLVLHRDRLVVDERYAASPTVDTPIITGFTDTTMLSNRKYNTVDSQALSYVHMPRSYNRRGGAQFSYSFWIFLGDTSPAAVKGACVLMRGDTRLYTYSRSSISSGYDWDDGRTDERPGLGSITLLDRPQQYVPGALVTGVAIKCPRIAFGDTYDHLVVTFNTTDDLDVVMDVSKDAAVGAAPFALSLIDNRWALMTFTFEDHTPINDFEDGITVNFFLNDVLYRSGAFRGALRQNGDAIHLFPGGGISGARIGDLQYSNYAWGAAQVKKTYLKGPPRKRMNDPVDDAIGEPLYLTEYNKLDVYS